MDELERRIRDSIADDLVELADRNFPDCRLTPEVFGTLQEFTHGMLDASSVVLDPSISRTAVYRGGRRLGLIFSAQVVREGGGRD